jgi:putative glycerol-1-phosphate prenyltransferase/phosphoglycerol geranylgeranyltransferase
MTRKATNLNIIAGGGIITPQDAAARVKAGANVVVTGNIWETNPSLELMREFAAAVHNFLYYRLATPPNHRS